MADKKNTEELLLTKEGLAKLEEELDQLKNVKRKEVAKQIKEAISYGDLSENAEYDAAKNEQAFVEGRIIELEMMIKNAKIVKDSKKSSGTIVQFGSTVTIVDQDKKDADEETYTIVGSTEADPFNGKISNESPLGHALIERKKGEVVEYEAPKGKVKYKILGVK